MLYRKLLRNAVDLELFWVSRGSKTLGRETLFALFVRALVPAHALAPGVAAPLVAKKVRTADPATLAEHWLVEPAAVLTVRGGVADAAVPTPRLVLAAEPAVAPAARVLALAVVTSLVLLLHLA